MNVLNSLQKTIGTKGIGVSMKDDKGIYTKYFLFFFINQAEKFFNQQKKLHGNKVSVNIKQVIY